MTPSRKTFTVKLMSTREAKRCIDLSVEIKLEPESPPNTTYEYDEQVEDEPSTLECPICMENLFVKPITVTTCGHLYCDDCLQVMPFNKTKGICALCNAIFYKKSVRKVYLS